MNYTGRYGLEINPFIKNGKDVLVETNEYKEVKFRLNYLLQTKGFGILTGGAGRGKTTSVRQWANELCRCCPEVRGRQGTVRSHAIRLCRPQRVPRPGPHAR